MRATALTTAENLPGSVLDQHKTWHVLCQWGTLSLAGLGVHRASTSAAMRQLGTCTHYAEDTTILSRYILNIFALRAALGIINGQYSFIGGTMH